MLHRKIEFKISTAVPVGAAFLVPKVAGGTQKGTQSVVTDTRDTARQMAYFMDWHVACADCVRTRLRNKAARLFGAIADPEVITTFGTHLPPQTPNRVPRRWRGARVPTWHGSKRCWRSETSMSNTGEEAMRELIGASFPENPWQADERGAEDGILAVVVHSQALTRSPNSNRRHRPLTNARTRAAMRPGCCTYCCTSPTRLLAALTRHQARQLPHALERAQHQEPSDAEQHT
jgi:hypothetical protein